jgi:hypothetical protein
MFTEQDWVLDSILENADPGGLLRLIAPADIAPIAMELFEAIGHRKPRHPLPRTTVNP